MQIPVRCLLLCLAVAGCAASSGQPTTPAATRVSPGESREAAIEVCKPAGERAYLDTLACQDGSPPAYRRVGSVGVRTPTPATLTKEQGDEILRQMMNFKAPPAGVPDYHVIDEYELSCASVRRRVYLDMYHCDAPASTELPDGFQRRR